MNVPSIQPDIIRAYTTNLNRLAVRYFPIPSKHHLSIFLYLSYFNVQGVSPPNHCSTTLLCIYRLRYLHATVLPPGIPQKSSVDNRLKSPHNKISKCRKFMLISWNCWKNTLETHLNYKALKHTAASSHYPEVYKRASQYCCALDEFCDINVRI